MTFLYSKIDPSFQDILGLPDLLKPRTARILRDLIFVTSSCPRVSALVSGCAVPCLVEQRPTLRAEGWQAILRGSLGLFHGKCWKMLENLLDSVTKWPRHSERILNSDHVKSCSQDFLEGPLV